MSKYTVYFGLVNTILLTGHKPGLQLGLQKKATQHRNMTQTHQQTKDTFEKINLLHTALHDYGRFYRLSGQSKLHDIKHIGDLLAVCNIKCIKELLAFAT